MRISDWSSDVCSSDLHRKSPKGACLNYRARIGGADHGRHQGADRPREATAWNESSNRGSCRADLYSWCRQQSRLSVYLSGGRDDLQWDRPSPLRHNGCAFRPVERPADRRTARHADRKSVVKGKSVSVRVDLGGRRIIKKKKKI